MYVIEVIPLRKAVQLDSLSYFSSTPHTPGTILTIPIRNSQVQGVVSGCKSVSTTKTALRAATFSLRKLPPQTETQTLSKALIKTGEELATYYATSMGAVLYNLLPPDIRSGELPLPHTHHAYSDTTVQPEVMHAHKKERYLAYRSLVREVFAHSASVLAVVPSSAHADEMRTLLATGIEDRIIMLTSTMTKKELRGAYAHLEDFSKPKLIIATSAHAVIERHDITTVIVENARSPYYKERVRPYLDYRDVLRVHAKHTGRRLIFGDLLPRSEEEEKRRDETYLTHGETPKRVDLPGTIETVHLVAKPDSTTAFKLFSDTVVDAILDAKKRRAHCFLFAARRGLAPVVACIDCGYIFRSPESGAPFSLIRIRRGSEEERWFVCSSSGHRERAKDTCTECGSWRLRERGIGIQYVYDELSKIISGTPIIQFDHTSAGTHKKACFLTEKFYGTKGSIMIGTPMSLPYLTHPIDTTVVVNMDALYATPTWRLQEENLALLLELREKTTGTVYVQTRTKDESLIEEARRGAVEHFYDEELELRKTFNYPPYTTFIHLTWQGNAQVVHSLDATVERTLTGFDVTTYAAPPSPKALEVHYGLVRVASRDWPLAPLVVALRKLPPSVRIVINPDRIV